MKYLFNEKLTHDTLLKKVKRINDCYITDGLLVSLVSWPNGKYSLMLANDDDPIETSGWLIQDQEDAEVVFAFLCGYYEMLKRKNTLFI